MFSVAITSANLGELRFDCLSSRVGGLACRKEKEKLDSFSVFPELMRTSSSQNGDGRHD